MSDDLSIHVKAAIQRAVLFHPLFEGTAADALEIAIAAIKAGDEIRNCPECAAWKPGKMMPNHKASDRCESGKRPHCTCDICF